MAFWRRRRAPAGISPSLRPGRGFDPDDLAHLEDFLRTRHGVEAYVEPATTMTPHTVVLVAHDGEWTRRPCEDPGDAAGFAARHRLPCYDVAATGYPPRMRAWTAARKRRGGDGRPAAHPRVRDEELPPDPFA